MTHTYNITGMTCGSCVARVKNELLKMGDVVQAEVQLSTPQAVITMNKHIGTATLQQAISKAGHYTITENGHAMKDMQHEQATDDAGQNSYYPVFLIFGYIAIVSLLAQFTPGHFLVEQWMRYFMAGFFLVFSFFKLLDIKGFAEGYGTYDIIAKRFPAWGFIYPFIELLFGLLFITGLYSLGTNIATFIVMGISMIGVVQSLLKKTQFQCACLGTIIKLPLGKVTLFEDLLMVLMSGIMILLQL